VPTLDEEECRRRFAAADVAVLGTHGPGGRVDLVPVTFVVVDDVVLDDTVVHDVVVDDTVVHAVDHKPKSTRRLQRLANIDADPSVTLLVDHYEADWSALWWVRAVGRAVVVPDPPGEAVEALGAKYRPYRERPPAGPFVVTTVQEWSGWSATRRLER
jgi:PPOX class probable F420-dependent enzyme